jgi:predicted transposase YbfD/YdcC
MAVETHASQIDLRLSDRSRQTLIASLPTGEAAPEVLLCANRGHWGIEIMHRNKDVILDEDGYTNRSDNAPHNIFSLIGFALKSKS